MSAMSIDSAPRRRPATPASLPAAPPSGARPSVAARRGDSAPIRLTRRGRAVVVLLLAALLLVAFALGRSTTADAGSTAPVVRRSVVVRPGETLWSIAKRTAPAADPRETVARLIEINDLGTRPVRAGERITLP